MSDTCILIVSCDPYRDVWRPFFQLFRKYWPDCPYDVYLQTNHLDFDEPGVTVIKCGPDIDWSSNLIRALERLSADRVLLLLEDFFFTQPVNGARLRRLESFMTERQAAYLRLVPKPPPDRPCADQPGVGAIAKGAPYRMSTQASFWDRRILIGLLRSGESAWEAEMAGSRRSAALERSFLSVDAAPREDWPLCYMNTVIKRKWTPEAVAFCRQAGVPLDLSLRPVCGWFDQLRRKRGYVALMELVTRLGRGLLGERLYNRVKNHPFLRRLVY
ncbi:MAG: hypothetical protein IID48_01270 [Proteobacteria bacterium]|nr:hypothetical protein [Pseudomonadota bacterium]